MCDEKKERLAGRVACENFVNHAYRRKGPRTKSVTTHPRENRTMVFHLKPQSRRQVNNPAINKSINRVIREIPVGFIDHC